MAGHSKWANIKHRKGAQDARRGKAFTKVAKEISIAARDGGADPNFNPRLRLALAKAKSVNMPNDNVSRAIKRGIGGEDGAHYEEITYEGYAPGGIAVLVQCLTDNRNRTVGDVRFIFTKRGGSLGESGCVGWMFKRKGVITIPEEGIDEEEFMLQALELGADDVVHEDEMYEVTTTLENFMAVKEGLEAAGIALESAELAYVPDTTVTIDDEKVAQQVLALNEALEDNDDVQDVYMNFDISSDIMEKISG
ncbi:YebC/PmpR family DNA-binding transcriptional regulator [Chrysiogenes arsenatis]|uniref:YebC/PmpR family DNA-binding transcriptional regulator n=1 Tax=Chrysiogenes arsenatis TaxID=309797 RepID=UPI0004139994|nr:YebC/PmpR family DNA-binding transcriptional regulator [Chrysiogenes arsenatis]